MRFNIPVALSLVAIPFANALPAPQDAVPSTPSPDPSIALNQLLELAQHASEVTNVTLETGSNERRSLQGSCTLGKLSVRREWGSLTKTERKAYIKAVQCLQAKPAKTDSIFAPGAKTRFDDWVAAHISQTGTIHYTGTFLSWHRYFTWAFEQALRTECGYTGSQPYWDWAKTALTGLERSPIFDGSETSFGGNGAYIPGNEKGRINVGGPVGSDLPQLWLPTGYGGGCITSGPFKDMKVNLGPVALALPDGTTTGNGNGMGYNPRCLTRDLVDSTNKRFANATSVVRNILNYNDIDSFQNVMQGIPGTGDLGIHGGPHLSLGGDPGRDTYTTPADPVFYLHHSAIDRVWWIWQSLNYNTRTGAKGISGTQTFMNMPPSANVTLDTEVDLGFVGVPKLKLRDLLSTTEGPFCYTYL